MVNRTEWSPIQSEIIQSDLGIISMITDRIGQHTVLVTN